MSSSEHNSSESGWTMYLNQSSISSYQYPQRSRTTRQEEEEEEEEENVDLSMISDASSGPPHLNEDEQDHEYRTKPEKESKKGKKMKMKKKQNQSIDDTASSPPSHDLSQKQKFSKGSDEHGMGSNARKSKGKSTSVGQSYSRSSVK
ncbi:protein SOB FIVE-LIKE 5-like [Impatiens glandulifera]|uniref:protein SOB FIVE-LIKE 5-like n=1 Tax=Impatiens glandulifera TaxID=253017 RepID=UPI001FB1078B|nr:protein SOB FIVE-LIKE 5-like [Impatiens glandulifera]